MPGPVSDSYDPVWGTGANAAAVQDGIREVVGKIATALSSPPRYILDVVREENGRPVPCEFSERELRIIRYGLRVALEEEEL